MKKAIKFYTTEKRAGEGEGIEKERGLGRGINLLDDRSYRATENLNLKP